ncbi:MAG: Rpn family recombination-promoting nuclease/putative transposase [Cyanobacteria bacterium J06648_16]
MFDTVCKFLVESFPADFAAWLLGERIELSELSPSELSLEPIRADILLLQSADRILHIEFQSRPDSDIAFRMTDYRLRLYRRFPAKSIHQVVIYLKPSQSSLVYQTAFDIPNTYHEFNVIRLWEQPTERFLSTPGLLPLAPLTQHQDRVAVLQKVAAQVENLPDQRAQ